MLPAGDEDSTNVGPYRISVRFRREMAAAHSVGGVFTAPVLAADTEGPTLWSATPYFAGPSLQEALCAHGPTTEAGAGHSAQAWSRRSRWCTTPG
jgi:hypothetical protein